PLFHPLRSEDDPWNPMKLNRTNTPLTTVGAASSITAPYDGDIVSEPDLEHARYNLPPIGAYLGPTHKHIHSRTRGYRAASIPESVRTEPSWITTNTDADALSGFSERDTVLSGGSEATGRGVSTTPWRCDECEKSFTSRGGLSKHKKVGTHGQRSHR